MSFFLFSLNTYRDFFFFFIKMILRKAGIELRTSDAWELLIREKKDFEFTHKIAEFNVWKNAEWLSMGVWVFVPMSFTLESTQAGWQKKKPKLLWRIKYTKLATLLRPNRKHSISPDTSVVVRKTLPSPIMIKVSSQSFATWQHKEGRVSHQWHWHMLPNVKVFAYSILFLSSSPSTFFIKEKKNHSNFSLTICKHHSSKWWPQWPFSMSNKNRTIHRRLIWSRARMTSLNREMMLIF